MGLFSKDKDGVSAGHKRSIVVTYAVVTIAFISMLCLNIWSYNTITKISKMYISLDNAAINIRLKTINANLTFREIVSGYRKPDMNAVWSLLEEALSYSSVLSEIGEEKKLEDNIHAYKAILLECYKAKDLPKDERPPDLNKKYNKAFNNIMKHIGKFEKNLKKLIDEKKATFKTLFIALNANLFLLFCCTIYSFWRYSVQRKDTEEKLKSTQENLNTILNSIDSLIMTVDPQERIVQWNYAAENYYGKPRHTVIGSNIWETVPLLNNYKSKIETVFHSNKPRTFYREVYGKPGQERYYNIALNFCPGINGVVIRIDDITKHELVEEQIRQSQKMEVVENLIGGLAHDFNNVLGAITGTISMMKFSLENPDNAVDEIKNNIDIIESSTERAVVMVQQLLSLSQKNSAEFVPLDLNSSVRHILKICENTFDKRVELIAELFDVKSLIKGDPAQIEQVILNLCDNAAQSMTIMREPGEAQGGELTISIDKVYPDKHYRTIHPKASEAAYWIVRISDTGVGMTAETINKMFDPFFTTKSQGEGSGLGLTLVNDIVQQHNGFIEVDSEVGNGTTFSIFLPEYSKGKAVEEEEEISVDEEERIPVGSGTVFVVDDEAVMRKTAASILKKLGYNVIFAENGEEAVEIYREKHREIGLTLLDMAMPKKSGKDAYVEMKQINPDLKVLLVSGFAKDKRIDDVLKLGVNGFIKKPYSMVTLAQEVKKQFDA